MSKLIIGITTGLAIGWILKFLFEGSGWEPQLIWWACAGLFIVLFAIIWTVISIENKFWEEKK